MKVLGTLACLVLAVPATALAQDWPAKPIRLVVPYPTTGVPGVVARAIAQRLTVALRQTVVPDFRPGASTIIGTELAARSPADGYTLFLGSTTSHAINPHLHPKLPYDPLNDFDAVIGIASVPFLLAVNSAVPVKTLRELVAYAKSNRRDLNYASFGTGTVGHLATELFRLAAGIYMVHVPYKGSATGENDLLAGRIDVMFTAFTVVPLARAGRIRILAVTTAQRSALLPDVPTVAEMGYAGFEVTGWFGLFAPAGVPRAILRALNAEMYAVLRSPDVLKRFKGLGLEPGGGTAEQLSELVRVEYAKWAHVIRAADIKLD